MGAVANREPGLGRGTPLEAWLTIPPSQKTGTLFNNNSSAAIVAALVVATVLVVARVIGVVLVVVAAIVVAAVVALKQLARAQPRCQCRLVRSTRALRADLPRAQAARS